MSTYTPSLGLELITPGSQAGLWGNTTNNSLNLIDQAITGVTPISFASASGSTYTLTDYNGAEDEARAAVLNITGSAIGANTVVIPNKQKTYLVRNSTGQNVTFQTPSPSATYAVEAGYSILIFCDGNNNVFTGIAAPSVGTLSVSGGGTGSTSFGSGGFIKSSGTTNALTASSTVNAATELSGAVPVANGGTGAVSLTSGSLLVGNGTGAVASLTGGIVGYVPTWNGSTWVSSAPAASGVSSLSAGTGISVSGSTGAVTVTNVGVTSLSAGTGISLSGSTGNVQITASSAGVSSFSAGTTGFTPSTSTTGAIVLGGTLGVANGGTGATTASNARTNLGLGTMATETASNYGKLATGSTWTAAQTVSGLGSAVAGWIVSSGGLTGFLSNNSVQLGYAGQGLQGASNSIALITGASSIYGFYNTGYAYAPAGGGWIVSSDARLKENVTTIDSCLGKVMQLNPVKYSFKKDNLSQPNKYGLLAQELEQVVPEVVSTSEMKSDGVENIKGVSYQELVPILIKAIQELKAEVDALKAAQ